VVVWSLSFLSIVVDPAMAEWDEWELLMQRTSARVIFKKMSFVSLRHRFWQWHAAARHEAAAAATNIATALEAPFCASEILRGWRGDGAVQSGGGATSRLLSCWHISLSTATTATASPASPTRAPAARLLPMPADVLRGAAPHPTATAGVACHERMLRTLGLLRRWQRCATTRSWAQWQSAVVHGRASEGMARRCLVRATFGMLASALESWKEHTKLTGQQRAAAQRERELHVVREQQDQRQQGQAMRTISRVIRRWAKRATARAWAQWLQGWIALDSMQASARRCMLRLLHATLSRAFGAWHHDVLRKRASAARMRHDSELRIAEGQMAASLRAAGTRLIDRAVRRWVACRIQSAWCKWFDNGKSDRRFEALARRCTLRMLHLSLRAAFSQWYGGALIVRSLNADEQRNADLSALRRHMGQSQQVMALRAAGRVVRRRDRARLHWSWETWWSLVRATKRTDTAARRWMLHLLCVRLQSAWALWREGVLVATASCAEMRWEVEAQAQHTAQSQEVRAAGVLLQAGVLRRCAARRVRRCWESWRAKCSKWRTGVCALHAWSVRSVRAKRSEAVGTWRRAARWRAEARRSCRRLAACARGQYRRQLCSLAWARLATATAQWQAAVSALRDTMVRVMRRAAARHFRAWYMHAVRLRVLARANDVKVLQVSIRARANASTAAHAR